MKYKAFQFRLGAVALVAVTSFLMLCALTVLAQSGRRAKKSSTPPVPTPEATATPTPSPTPERPAIPIFVGANSFDSYGDIPFYFNDSVAKSCAQGLQHIGAIRVELSSRDFTRGDAIKRAKEAKYGFVVLLELRSDRIRTGNRSSNLSTVYIEFAVFAARTAKPVTSGTVYQQASRGLGDILGGRSDSARVAEQRLKNAARVAADRILSAVLGPGP